MSKRTVLFLCTGNSCRSHMAEGMVNHYLADNWTAFSAGTDPAGYVHPMAIAAMAEIGINITDHTSKSTKCFSDMFLGRVITVCDDAAENCPIWLGRGKISHLGFPDPAEATGTDMEKMRVFRQVRDEMREQILELLTTTT